MTQQQVSVDTDSWNLLSSGRVHFHLMFCKGINVYSIIRSAKRMGGCMGYIVLHVSDP